METWILLWFSLRIEGILEQIIPLLWALVSLYYKLQLFRHLMMICPRVISVRFPDLPVRPWEPDKEAETFPQKRREVADRQVTGFEDTNFATSKVMWARMKAKGLQCPSAYVLPASFFNHFHSQSSCVTATKILPAGYRAHLFPIRSQ